MNQQLENYSISPCNSTNSLVYQSGSPVSSSYCTWPAQYQFQYSSSYTQPDYNNYEQQHQQPHYYANSAIQSSTEYSFSNNSYVSTSSDYNSNHSSDVSYSASYSSIQNVIYKCVFEI